MGAALRFLCKRLHKTGLLFEVCLRSSACAPPDAPIGRPQLGRAREAASDGNIQRLLLDFFSHYYQVLFLGLPMPRESSHSLAQVVNQWRGWQAGGASLEPPSSARITPVDLLTLFSILLSLSAFPSLCCLVFFARTVSRRVRFARACPAYPVCALLSCSLSVMCLKHGLVLALGRVGVVRVLGRLLALGDLS